MATPDVAMDLVREWGLVLIFAAIVISLAIGFIKDAFRGDDR